VHLQGTNQETPKEGRQRAATTRSGKTDSSRPEHHSATMSSSPNREIFTVEEQLKTRKGQNTHTPTLKKMDVLGRLSCWAYFFNSTSSFADSVPDGTTEIRF
jgi:hypothetical protein